MKDTLETDFAAMAREYWLCLGKADRLRWLDARVAEMGSTEPLAEFHDIREDARFWVDSCLAEVLKVYFAAIWASFSDAEKEAFRRWDAKSAK